LGLGELERGQGSKQEEKKRKTTLHEKKILSGNSKKGGTSSMREKPWVKNTKRGAWRETKKWTEQRRKPLRNRNGENLAEAGK